jgi:hypothetical protein
MKKMVLLVAVVLSLMINLTALTYGGVDLGKWQVFGTEPEKPK